MSIANFFASKVTDLDFNKIDAEVLHWAKVGILDTVGVTLAGANESCVSVLSEILKGSSGPAVIFGTNQQCSALDAALINGTASHALDFDDCNNTMGGHPSVPILPALFALADEVKVSGKNFIAAYVAGFEVETKLAMMVNFYHYSKGWHPTSTLGIFGSAAACSKLLNLTQEQTKVALAIAASNASGLKANFGSMTKPLHIGRCAREGLLAAKLAKNGFTANVVDIFEHPQGFLEVYNGAGNYDIEKGLQAWGDPFDIVKPGIAIKQYPCCGSTHPAIDCAIELQQSHQIKIDEIESINIWIHERRLKHTNRPSLKSELDAKFSIQYVVARAITDGCVSIEHFEESEYSDPKILKLMQRIQASPYGDVQFSPENHFGGQLRIQLKDGTVLETKVQEPLGRTSDNPLPENRLRAKFELCASRVLVQGAITKAYELITQFESIQDVSDLTLLLKLIK
jgi:2-methylcitrate dehydratase PrpD